MPIPDSDDDGDRQRDETSDPSSQSPAGSESVARKRSLAWRLPLFRNVMQRMPVRSRPALFFETFYNIGVGAIYSLLLLSTVVLKTVLPGTETHLAVLAAMFGGSSLLSPLVSYLGRWAHMRSIVVYANFAVAAALFAVVFRIGGPTWFVICVGTAFVIRVFPRVAEMNMYRVLYPAHRRGTAVGWGKAVAGVAGLSTTVIGYVWFDLYPSGYWVLYCLVSLVIVSAAFSYRRIPISKRNIFARDDVALPHHALRDGIKVFLKDRRFILYQFGFALAGIANHMSIVFIPEVLKEHLHADATVIGLAGAVLPATLMMSSAPFWGRFLDNVNPMTGRATFNTIQCLAFAFDAYGGITLQVWPFIVGALLHGTSNGGGAINWLTGSLYFARSEHISLYNAIHVCLTGMRGLITPAIGLYLISESGLNMGPKIFAVSAALSLLGAVVMGIQGWLDPGPREGDSTRESSSVEPILDDGLDQ